MSENRRTLNRFYRAFAHLDPDSMASCYAPDVRFEDAIFTLEGRDQVMAMWRMLCEAAASGRRADWKLNYHVISADADTGRLNWSARYTFGKDQRPVHNRIQSVFAFNAKGQISQHYDHFNFWRWSRQALDVPGLLLGWSPALRRQVRSKALHGLNRHIAGQPILMQARPAKTEESH